MKSGFNNHIVELSEFIQKSSLKFLDENVKCGVKLAYVFNIIGSAHITSLFNCLKSITEPNTEEREMVDSFIFKILGAISSSDIVNKVEIFDKEIIEQEGSC